MPAGTPKPVIQSLYQEMKRALAVSEVSRRLNAAGLDPVGGTGAELAELVKRDIPRFRKLIQDIGIQPE